MKKSLIFLFAFMTVYSGFGYHVVGQLKVPKKHSISEGTEWSNTWMVSTNKHDLPRVLIVGDSHVERYYQVVAGKLNKKAYCCKFTTSRSLGDPALIAQLKALFFSYQFDVICFNNGLHGTDYAHEQYRKSNPGVKLIWVNTTARRVGGNLKEFDQYNSGVISRNKSVEEQAKAVTSEILNAIYISDSQYL
jgi:hypothetical protein